MLVQVTPPPDSSGLPLEPSASPLPGEGQEGHPYWPVAIVSVLILALNALLVFGAWKDSGWGAVGIAFVLGPGANVGLGLLLLACSRWVKRQMGGASLTPYLLTSIFLPIVASLADLLVISSMNLHGC